MKTRTNPRLKRRGIITTFLLCTCLPSLGWLAPGAALADDGRDFAGSYQISGAVRSGRDVTVTISLTFVNYGDEPLRGARVTLKDPLTLGVGSGATSAEHGAFAAVVSLDKRASNRLSGTFRIPAAEFDQWLNGREPRFVLTRTVNGQKVERPIVVVRTGVQP